MYEGIRKAIPQLKLRANTLQELLEQSSFYLKRPNYNDLDEKTKNIIYDISNYLPEIIDRLENNGDWSSSILNNLIKDIAKDLGVHFAKPLRIILSGSHKSAGNLSDIMTCLSKEEVMVRLKNALVFVNSNKTKL